MCGTCRLRLTLHRPAKYKIDRSYHLPVAMDMMTNDTTIDPSSRCNGLGRRPRELRVTPLRHRMDKGGPESTVLKTKVWVGLPMIFPLHLLHSQKSATCQNHTSTHTDPAVQYLSSIPIAQHGTLPPFQSRREREPTRRKRQCRDPSASPS